MQIIRITKFFLFISFISFLFSFTGGVASSRDNTIEQDILYYVNLDRKSKGLGPLKLNTYESSLAAKHSEDMAKGKVPFGHEGLQARAKAIQKQIRTVTSVGENVASGLMTAKEAVEGWLQSPGHKRNIEGDFTLTGIGWARGKQGMIYFTQIFSK